MHVVSIVCKLDCIVHNAPIVCKLVQIDAKLIRCARPIQYVETIGDADVEDFLFDMFERLDSKGTGLIEEVAFWELLEVKPPHGFGVTDEDSFTMMSRFDHSINGEVRVHRIFSV